MTTISDNSNATLLVPLDALLDTHMGTVYLLSPDSMSSLLRCNYHKRDYNHPWDFTDDFNRSDFCKRWKNRDIETLKVSIVTRMLETIKVSVLRKEIGSIATGGKYNATVKINTYPYALKQVEVNELKHIVASKLDFMVEVSTVNVSHSELSPIFLRDNKITTFIVTDFEEWITEHYISLANNPIPHIECVAPILSEDYVNRLQNAIRAGKVDGDLATSITPFEALEICMSYLIKLSFLPVELFSFPVFENGKK